MHKKNLGWIALISVLTIGYRFTQVAAVGMASVALVLAIKRTSVFWATIIGGKIFSDKDLIEKKHSRNFNSDWSDIDFERVNI